MSTPTEQAGSIVVTGVTAFALATGLDPRVMVWAITGSVFGVALAKPSGRLYGFAVFIAASLACALMGTAIADWLFAGSHIARNAVAMLCGAGFHPMLSAFIEAAPGLVKGVINIVQRRIGGGTQ